jgi:hypothetical protein
VPPLLRIVRRAHHQLIPFHQRIPHVLHRISKRPLCRLAVCDFAAPVARLRAVVFDDGERCIAWCVSLLLTDSKFVAIMRHSAANGKEITAACVRAAHASAPCALRRIA